MVSRRTFIRVLVVVALVAAFFGYQYGTELNRILDSISITRDSSMIDRLKDATNQAKENLTEDVMTGDMISDEDIIDISEEILEEITESSEQVVESVEEVVEEIVVEDSMN